MYTFDFYFSEKKILTAIFLLIIYSFFQENYDHQVTKDGKFCSMID